MGESVLFLVLVLDGRSSPITHTKPSGIGTESVGVGFSSQTISVRLTIGTSLPYLRGFFVWVPKQTPHAPFFPRTLPSECSRKQQALFSFWRTLRACRVPRKLRRVPRGPPSSVLFRLLVWRREWAVIWTNRSLQLRDWEVQSLPRPPRHSSDQTKSKLR